MNFLANPTKETQVKLLAIKTTISEIKNTLDVINIRLDTKE